MLKQILATLGLILSLTGSAKADDQANFNVQVSTAPGIAGVPHVDIQFQTTQTYAAMCERSIVALNLREPSKSAGLGIPRPAIGLIDAKTALSANAACVMTAGPQHGALSLELGQHLPALHNGYYRLLLDQESAGFVLVTDGAAQLLSEDDIPR